MAGKTRTGAGGRSWQRWNEEDARTALDELERTAESASGFARRKGFSTQRLRYWKKRLATTATPAFVGVTMPTAPASREPIEIRIGALSVVVQEGCDVEHVARLAEALSRRTRAC